MSPLQLSVRHEDVALLREELCKVKDQLKADSQRRIETNPLRVLDCKSEECRAATADAPHFLDYLCDPCREHFARVRAGLDSLGVGYTTTSQIVAHETGLDTSAATVRTFKLINGCICNRTTGTPVAYQLVPHPTRPLLAHASSFHAARSNSPRTPSG